MDISYNHYIWIYHIIIIYGYIIQSLYMDISYNHYIWIYHIIIIYGYTTERPFVSGVDPWVSVRHHIVHGDMDTAAIVQDLWVRAVSVVGIGVWQVMLIGLYVLCTPNIDTILYGLPSGYD